MAAAVPAAHEQLALVVRIDQSYEVAEHDPCLCPSPERGRMSAASSASAMWTAIPSNELDLTRRQRNRRIDARADPFCRADRSIRRQMAADPLVHDLEIDASGCGGMRRSTFGKPGGDFGDDTTTQLSLSIRGSGCAPASSNSVTVLVAAKGILGAVGDDQWYVLASALLLGVPSTS
jgi:hypothetical protein